MPKLYNGRMLIGVPLIIAAALVAGVCASSVLSPPASRYHMTKISDLYPPLGNIPYWQVGISSEWANEPWTGDDAPYQHIEFDADKALVSSWSIGNLLKKSSLIAQQEPSNSQAQFRWGYIAWRVVQGQPKSYDWSSATQAISVVLARVQSPKTYSYARLRFLLTRQDSDVVELGERLLKRDPNDVPVKYRLSDAYTALFSERSQRNRDHEVDPQLKQRALTLIEQVIAVSPSNPDYRAALAAVYVSSWADNKNPEDATNAVAAYKQYLKLAEADDNDRPHRMIIVDGLQEYLSAHPLP